MAEIHQIGGIDNVLGGELAGVGSVSGRRLATLAEFRGSDFINQ